MKDPTINGQMPNAGGSKVGYHSLPNRKSLTETIAEDGDAFAEEEGDDQAEDQDRHAGKEEKNPLDDDLFQLSRHGIPTGGDSAAGTPHLPIFFFNLYPVNPLIYLSGTKPSFLTIFWPSGPLTKLR